MVFGKKYNNVKYLKLQKHIQEENMKKQILSEEFKRMQKLAGIITEQTVNRFEIIDPQQTEQSLDMILDAIQLLNQNGLQLKSEDQSGHYSGGYKHINSMYVTSPLEFQELIRKANDILFQNDMEHLRIIEA